TPPLVHVLSDDDTAKQGFALLQRSIFRTKLKSGGVECGLSRMRKMRKSYYAVRVGREVGVFNTSEGCRSQVDKYSGAVYKGFSTAAEAESFVGASQASHARSTYGRSRSYHSGSYPQRRDREWCSESTSSVSYSQPSYSSWSDTVSYDHQPPSTSTSPSSYSGTSSSGSRSHSRPTVYSDGCCLNNGRVGASAGVGVYWGEGSPHNVSEKLSGPQTNQRAELNAAYRAVQSAVDLGHSAVEVKTDSSYTIKAMTEWLGKWKRNGWMTSQSAPVKNKEDIVRLDNACQKIDVKWTHVPGHSGVAGNEAADQLARAGSFK
ncbi:Ribonuclease H1, partial [Geodia barretti]